MTTKEYKLQEINAYEYEIDKQYILFLEKVRELREEGNIKARDSIEKKYERLISDHNNKKRNKYLVELVVFICLIALSIAISSTLGKVVFWIIIGLPIGFWSIGKLHETIQKENNEINQIIDNKDHDFAIQDLNNEYFDNIIKDIPKRI